MNLLIIGSGGREHAIAWKISQSSKVKNIYVAPGNPGINLEDKVSLIETDNPTIEDYISIAKENSIDLTIVGPEAPLVEGIVDGFKKNNLKIFGPNKLASQLEGSKDFCKNILNSGNVLTAKHQSFKESISAIKYVKEQNMPIVIKADGLAAGKGVFIIKDREKAYKLINDLFTGEIDGIKTSLIIIEEFLQGEEASFICLVSGNKVIPLASSKDHKKLNNGDCGPNTGGMGAYSPTKLIDNKISDIVITEIITPTLNELKKKNIEYEGFLYAGLMIDKNQVPYVLEYNCRLGDPEAQAILMRLESDIVEIFLATINKELDNLEIKWKSESACTIVLASEGYPGSYEKGKIIEGLDHEINGTKVFHSGTKIKDHNFITNGGRVISVTALGVNLQVAQAKAYDRS
ncbi:phosphoribosylamine--glycine ligase, partial [Gammaproteobacteria bacterium]|nr:phosphoribosylamine--glycine ligase [Gammaproteobacteria bacterium]